MHFEEILTSKFIFKCIGGALKTHISMFSTSFFNIFYDKSAPVEPGYKYNPHFLDLFVLGWKKKNFLKGYHQSSSDIAVKNYDFFKTFIGAQM